MLPKDYRLVRFSHPKVGGELGVDIVAFPGRYCVDPIVIRVRASRQIYLVVSWTLYIPSARPSRTPDILLESGNSPAKGDPHQDAVSPRPVTPVFHVVLLSLRVGEPHKPFCHSGRTIYSVVKEQGRLPACTCKRAVRGRFYSPSITSP